MSTDYLVEIPVRLLPVIGRPDPGTRIYRQKGPPDDLPLWHEAIGEVFPRLLSPGGVSMYAPVSRAAVHKALLAGRLTAFAFHVTKPVKTLFGGLREQRETPYVYIPSVEAQGWGKELEQRLSRREHITIEDLEGKKPDWHGKFWEWNERKHGK